jgi:NAD(P)-dependent dehydrogenase (short-subunit alcohol dehydrogenase family)
MLLAGKTAVVTGASEGIGFAIATALSDAGVNTVLTGRREHMLVQATEKLGSSSSYVVGDIAERGTAERTMRCAADRHGSVDLLVCNAGILLPGTVAEQPIDEVDRLIGVNLLGTIMTVQAAAPVLAAGQDAAMVVITSAIGRKPAPGLGIYGATKAALHYLVPTWATELAYLGIRVNAVCAGITMTPGVRMAAERIVGLEDLAISTSLIKRVATAEEVARPVLTLLDGSLSGFVTGSVWDIDGGHLLDLRGRRHSDGA